MDIIVEQRKSTRLKSYDYSKPGAYFITICTHERQALFGHISQNEMFLNDYGKTVESEWMNTERIRKNIQLDEFTIMPNHFHAIMMIKAGGGVLQYAPTRRSKSNIQSSFQSPSQTIGSVIRGFKSAVTHSINALRNSPGSPVWQRNYYERVIRNENELNGLREYINYNPRNWETYDEYFVN